MAESPPTPRPRRDSARTGRPPGPSGRCRSRRGRGWRRSRSGRRGRTARPRGRLRAGSPCRRRRRPRARPTRARRARAARRHVSPAATASSTSSCSRSSTPSDSPRRMASSRSASRSSRRSAGSSTEPVSRYSADDAELRTETAQRLHRRLPRACLDAGDIGVRDAWRRELALREPLLQPQPLQPLPDGFGRRRPRTGAHSTRISWVVTRSSNVPNT